MELGIPRVPLLELEAVGEQLAELVLPRLAGAGGYFDEADVELLHELAAVPAGIGSVYRVSIDARH